MKGGARTWYFPDGYLPEKKTIGEMEAHEALMLFNTANSKISVYLDIYFSDAPPEKDIHILVDKESVKALRMDFPEDIGGLELKPLTQYAIRVRSEIPIVVQFGRLDTTQKNMAYYGSMGFFEN